VHVLKDKGLKREEKKIKDPSVTSK